MIRDWIAVRVDAALAARLNALAVRLGLNRHDIVRRAVLAGIAALERQPSLPELHR